MRKNKIAASYLCLGLLIESIILSFGGTAAYGAIETKEIRIESEDDLEREALNSRDGLYTAGKVFILTADLDMRGREMAAFQTLSGVFDGQGHIIRGLKYRGKNSDTGLFRYVEEGGEVRDLKVEADFFPSGDMKNIGGIAGINSGRIIGCSFSGKIIGKEAVGGIAGRNTEKGRIKNCENRASVQGMRRTGGIAGYNEGLIEGCKNSGNINAVSKTAWELDDERENTAGEKDQGGNENLDRIVPDNIDVGYDDLLSMIENEQKVEYTGGIAGVNSGTVKDSENAGTTGYRHTGYKTGGITGYERGIISDCVNTGNVYGRKNTGGISGHLEPYVREDFEKDSFEKAVKASDSLTGYVTSLQAALKDEDDSVQERIDAIRANADDLRGSISSYKDYYRGKDDLMEADMRSHTTAIRDVLNGIDVNLKTGKANEAFRALDEDINKLDEMMGAAERAAGNGVPLDMTNYVGSVRGISSDINDRISDLLTLAGNAGKEYNGLKASAEALKDRNDHFDDFLKNAYDSYKTDIRSTDDDLTLRVDRIADNMDALSDTLKRSDSVVRSGMDDINDSLQLLSDMIIDGFDEAREEIGRIRDTEDVNDIYDDISDTRDNSPGRGKIVNCENSGDISTDINGGGIAGMADTEVDPFSDFEVLSSGEVSLKRNRTKLALITGCVNRGTVTVKNNCAGGISGNMDAGAVISCENFGFINSRDGDYAGGIAGKSGYMIRDSFSMSVVSGNSYVGGIAGYGRYLMDNRTLSTIPLSVKEHAGAVAGDTDPEKGTVSGNIFVDDSLGAVNGLTYESQARAVTYPEFITLSGIPAEAGTMTVTFIAEGEKVGSLNVPYGGDVPPESFPELPTEGGKFGVWDRTELKDVRQNTVVNAEYVSYVTTIASPEPFPVLLITGRFYNGDIVSYEKKDAPSAGEGIPEGYLKAVAEYTFRIGSEGVRPPDSGETNIRVLADAYGERDTAAVRNGDGTYTVIPTTRDGRYLVFPYDCSSGEGGFVILEAAPDRKLAIGIGAGALLLILVLFMNILKKKVKKQPPKESTEA